LVEVNKLLVDIIMENLDKNIEGEFNKPLIPSETIEDLQKQLSKLDEEEKETIIGLKENEPGTSYYSDRTLFFIREKKQKVQEKIDSLREKETIQ